MCKRMGWAPHNIYKQQLKIINNLNIRTKPIKLREGNRIKFHEFEVAMILSCDTQPMRNKSEKNS